ncbi:MAG: alpha-L-rhamnosidase [Armatimonadetes bacterium]|nr:alpha-L-rhamnosidase [Armatimonadota bacterium]
MKPPRNSAVPGPSVTAHWVWADATHDHQTVRLRRPFDLRDAPKTAILYVTADDFFTLYVNGKQVDQSHSDANDGNVWQHVHRLDLTPYLTAGRNVLAIRAENIVGAAGFVARLELPGQPPIETDARWKVLDGPDAPQDWNMVAFDDSSWRPANVVAPVAGGQPWAGHLEGWPGDTGSVPYLAHLTLPWAKVVDAHPGAGKIGGADVGRRPGEITVTPPPVGATDSSSLVLDFGQEIAGRVMADGRTPGAVLVGTGESYEEATKSPWGGQHRLDLAPASPAYTPYSAFRYARLVFPPSAFGPIRLRVAVDHKYYPVQYKGSFDCSDPLLTKIWYTGAYTSHLCMQEDIWDAPKRDRARWIGDLHVSGEVINDAFADRFLMEQTLDRLRADAQGGRPDTDLPNDHVNGIPGYSCAWICCLADFHRHLGDYAFLSRQHDRLISLLEYMQGELDNRGVFINKRGKWPFVDWSPGFDGNSPLALAATHLFYVKAAHEAAFLLREMGDAANADKYAAWAEALTAAARQYLPDAATNTYGGRLQENAMAVYSGTATPAQVTAIGERVLNPDSDAWNKTGQPPYNNGVITPYYNNYVIYALSMAGRQGDALRVVRNDWGGMIAEGATTFWEGYDPHWDKHDFHAHLGADGNFGYYVSLCHGWSSGATSWLTERVLGVRPTGGGFKTAEIVPDLGDLQWVEGDVPAPGGVLRVRASLDGGRMSVSVTLPPGVDAVVGVPGSAATVNGRRVTPVRAENGRIYVRLRGAGKYVIGGA